MGGAAFGLAAGGSACGDGRMSEADMQLNREMWDAWADLHYQSEFYGVDAFCRGKSTLPTYDVEGVGPVRGARLLHLQCHFGMDTLSWARLGAEVTGLDFSGRAIALARRLAERCGLSAEFVEANVYDAPEVLGGARFSAVVATAGVIAWLPDLKRWGRVVADVLAPGGVFYLREFHPVSYVFGEDSKDPHAPVLRYPYFSTGEAIRLTGAGSYAEPGAAVRTTSCEWAHPLAEVIQALLEAGLILEFMREYPFTTYRSFPWLEEGTDGNWRWPGNQSPLPLMYALRVRKAPG